MNRSWRWITSADKSNVRDPLTNITVNDTQRNCKRSYPTNGNEAYKERLIKYRRVDNTFNTFFTYFSVSEHKWNRCRAQESIVEEKYEPDNKPFTEDQQHRYIELILGSCQKVLVSKFRLNITRNDICTLIGTEWLNDEIINFYMNLITERSQIKQDELPSVYAMNTFFMQRLLQEGHEAVKRWTRKVDIFGRDIILVPVHVRGSHWSLAIIHMKDKAIRYYDSKGKFNHLVLISLEEYLREESMDKRKVPFDTSVFQKENVENIPQQTNKNDCGVFSCMFAEYITRNKPLNFSQHNMEYFRKKMVLEICEGKLWN